MKNKQVLFGTSGTCVRVLELVEFDFFLGGVLLTYCCTEP